MNARAGIRREGRGSQALSAAACRTPATREAFRQTASHQASFFSQEKFDIHAVTLDGFLLKVSMFVIAFALDKAFIQQPGLITPCLYKIRPVVM